MLPGLITWSVLALPFVFSIFSPRLTILFILGYMLLWFAKAVGLDLRALQGFRLLQQYQKLPWLQMFDDLKNGQVRIYEQQIPKWHIENINRVLANPTPIKAEDIIHAVIIASYNESREILEPTVQSVLASDFPMDKVILVFAYEGRDGAQSEAAVIELMEKYKGKFKHVFAAKHPLTEGEVRGKGGNITYAGRKLKQYLEKEGIKPLNVVVTTLDSDNRPHKKYLAAAAYLYAVTPDPVRVSLQPIPMFTNNIWDAPAPMRVIATGNSFWMVVQGLRTHMLRNFSAHAQNMQTLIDTDFWSTRTIVEDGHQFWRTYFRYDGHHQVYPIFLPIYQDAVLSTTLLRTLRAQFIQIRRWAWGASDVAYVAEMGFFRKDSKASKLDATFKFFRLLEGHISWATAPLILAFSAFIPALFNHKDYAANQLPIIASRVQTIALIGIFVTLFFSLKTLPPKPARYKKHRTVFMILQWVYLPVTTITYSAFSAIYSQTRLMFGRYLDKFDVTDKAFVTEDKQKHL
ncbi:MAG TPA: glycosyltransferase family 2 protein [Candidatus Saccharimonadales bacterium]|nr:glycosyltransferase family 2 protein [Candidatus Saccharimonadales bacterium]